MPTAGEVLPPLKTAAKIAYDRLDRVLPLVEIRDELDLLVLVPGEDRLQLSPSRLEPPPLSPA